MLIAADVTDDTGGRVLDALKFNFVVGYLSTHRAGCCRNLIDW